MSEQPDLVKLFLALEERLDDHERSGDARAVLEDPEASAQAEALWDFGVYLPENAEWPTLVLDWDIAHLLARWHHARSELDVAVSLFSLVHQAAPDAVPEPLREQVRALPTPEFGDLRYLFESFLAAFTRGEASGDRGAIESAIRLAYWGVIGVPDGHMDKPTLLSNLSASLRMRSALNNDPADLEVAVAAGKRAVELAPADHTNRAMILHNYSCALHDQFRRTRSAEDLDAAVDLARQATAIVSPDDPLYPAGLSNLGMTLAQRFHLQGKLPDITEAVWALREAVRATPAGNQVVAANVHTNLALALNARFMRLGDPADLDTAIVAATGAVEVCPPDHPDAARCLAHLNEVLITRFDHSADPADGDAAVDAARRAAAPEGQSPRIALLDSLGLALRHRGSSRHDLADLTEAVRVYEQAVSAVPQGSAERARNLAGLCDSRLTLFGHTGQLADVDAAVDAGWQAAHGSAEHPERYAMLIPLGAALHARAERTGSADDLDKAVALLEKARECMPDAHPAMTRCLSELGRAHEIRFVRTGSLTDLDKGIAVNARSVEVAGQHDPKRVTALVTLTHFYGLRFEQTGNLADLHAAIERGTEAVRATPENHNNRAYAEYQLGQVKRAQFERTGSLADLEEAVQLLESAGRRVNCDPEQHAMMLSTLGLALQSRYERLDRKEDGERAIELSRRAAKMIPADHPDRARYLSHLNGALTARGRRTGSPEDAEAAVAAGREAVRLAPNEASYLANLGTALHTRYGRSFALSDLDEGIQSHRAAVESMSADHPLQVQTLSNLAVALLARISRTRDLASVDEAIEIARAAVEATPADHAARPMRLSNYAGALHMRHYRTKDSQDAEKGVAALQEALRLTPDDHPSRMQRLGSLATALEDWYSHSGRRRDLDAMIEAGRAALRAAPARHPGSCGHAYNLGLALITRAERTGSRTDLDTANDVFQDVTRNPAAPTELRIRSARRWGLYASVRKDWAEAVAGYRAALELLPLLAWHGLESDDRVSALGEFAGLPNSAAVAALMLDDPEQALQLLEQGRGVLLAQALDARDDLSELAAVDPGLAERMRIVRNELTSADPSVAAGEGNAREPTNRRRELAREWDLLLTRARELPGLTDFLRLPPVERLRSAAADGPVIVVNVHWRRCDALIVTTDGVRTVRLRKLKEAEIRDRTTTLLDALADVGDSVAGAWRAQRVLDQVLGWLWDAVAKPVLDAFPSDPARLWWCPTGLLTFLPLHAAGHHGPVSRSTLLDRVICSYTPTVRALAEARARAPAPAKMLAVGQPATPGLSPLPQALTEVRQLATQDPGATLLSDATATREAVLTALPRHTYLHFAGHGGQNPRDTVGGALYCADHQPAGPITVADISDLRLDHAELAFLSACETARGVITVPDEAVHMAGAMQLAGFRHVVATQWVVSDSHAAEIAKHFYTGLADETGQMVNSRAAAALHAAVRQLRDDEHAAPLLWASYIHTGP